MINERFFSDEMTESKGLSNNEYSFVIITKIKYVRMEHFYFYKMCKNFSRHIRVELMSFQYH